MFSDEQMIYRLALSQVSVTGGRCQERNTRAGIKVGGHLGEWRKKSCYWKTFWGPFLPLLMFQVVKNNDLFCPQRGRKEEGVVVVVRILLAMRQTGITGMDPGT